MEKDNNQYTDAELMNMKIKLHIEALDKSLINRHKYKEDWKNIVYNIWTQFGVDYFDGKYMKMLGHTHRFSWTQEVQDEFERIFKKELNTLGRGTTRFAFLLEYYPIVEKVDIST